MTETTIDAIARMQKVMEPVSKHLNGLHAEQYDKSCIECDRYRLGVEVAAHRQRHALIVQELGHVSPDWPREAQDIAEAVEAALQKVGCRACVPGCRFCTVDEDCGCDEHAEAVQICD